MGRSKHFALISIFTLLPLGFQNCAPTDGFRTIDSVSSESPVQNSSAPGAEGSSPNPQPQVPAPSPTAASPAPMPQPTPPAPAPMPAPLPDLATAYITKNWPTLRGQLKNQSSLYDQQILVQPFVEWIVDNKRQDLAKDLLDVYALRIPERTTETSLMAYGGVTGTSGGYSSVPVLHSYQAWMTEGPPRVETVLSVSQFLFGVSRLVNALDASDPRLAQWAPILKDTYLRWIRGIESDPTKGVFQVRGWGCGGSRYNHFEFIKKLFDKSFGTSVSYCNAVTDVDMWIITGATLLYRMNSQAPALKILTVDEASYLLSYIKLGAQLIGSRTTANQVSVDGVKEKSFLFDAGVWRDHPDSDYAGYSGDQFPTQFSSTPIKGPVTVNFDTSHMRRIVPVLNVLFENRSLISSSFPSTDDAKMIALQLSYGLFNGNYSFPQISNYSDGTNGWYRVNYSDRAGFGYHPYSMTSSYLTGGYCQFAKYEPRIRKLCSAILTRVQGTTTQDQSYKQMLLECYTNNYKKATCDNFNLDQVNFGVLNFLSSLR